MSIDTTNCGYTSGHLLEAKNLYKSFDGTVVLNDFSYKFDRGVYVLSEPSGAGKTTLLRILCGLEVADSGIVSKSPQAKTVMMFQEDRLLENLSVRANIMLAIQAHSQEQKQNARERITEALCAVGLEGTENKPVSELSGGQKRRVALLRTLFAGADILLFDEPLKGLDEALKQQVVCALTLMRFLESFYALDANVRIAWRRLLETIYWILLLTRSIDESLAAGLLLPVNQLSF